MPPPLPKPKQKKPEKVKEEYPQDQPFASHLQRSVIETAAKHVLCKYNYEKSLSEKLGFISVPVTKVLLEIMFGFKNVKGSNIKISSQINWAEVYQQIQTKCSSKSQKPRAKRSDKKSPPKPAMMRGKAEFSRKTPKKNITSLPDIIELVPLHFPEDLPQSGEDSQQQDSVELFREISSSAKSSIVLDSHRKLSVALFSTEDPSSVEVVKQSSLSQRVSITSGSVRKSSTVLLHTEENSVEHLEQAPSSQRTSTVVGSSRRSSAVLLGTESQNCVELLRQFSSSPRTSIASRSASKSSVVPLDTEGNSVESLRQPSLSERAITGESSPKSSASLPKI
ncbi:coiled-coil domain-containing protein 116 [Alligator mississippiensis]|uniref:coiled-coil domain-containing protein 116 n=1 Tax=Alligator mississippiensis TaxID=8496 RepID=UPI002877DF10|nr:coiled-coil domain-containing protein 116 [Alligator mississippiensis]